MLSDDPEADDLDPEDLDDLDDDDLDDLDDDDDSDDADEHEGSAAEFQPRGWFDSIRPLSQRGDTRRGPGARPHRG